MTGFQLLLRLAFRSLCRYKRRTILTLTLMVVGVWSCLLLSSFARGMSARLIVTTTEAFVGHVQIHSPKFVDDPSIDHRFSLGNIEEKLKADFPGIAARVARLNVPAVIMSERETSGVVLLATDVQQERKLSFLRRASIEGSFLTGPEDNGVLIGAALARKLQTAVGRRVVILTQSLKGGTAERGFIIKGIYRAPLEATEETFVLTGRDVAQMITDAADQVTEIAITVTDLKQIEAIRSNLQKVFPELKVETWKTLKPFLTAVQKLQGGFLMIWFGIVLLTAGLGLMNTMYMSVIERRKEFSLLGALGMSWPQILMQVILESALLLVCSMVLGTVSAYAVHSYFAAGIDLSAFARGAARIGMETTIYPIVLVSDWILLNILLAALGIAGTLLPAWIAAGVKPGVAIRGE